jgi:ABC-type antimicrobial peptide transport system permease subunit
MNLRESTRIEWQGLSGIRLRSALAMLGILLGVGSVIVLGAVGMIGAIAKGNIAVRIPNNPSTLGYITAK